MKFSVLKKIDDKKHYLTNYFLFGIKVYTKYHDKQMYTDMLKYHEAAKNSYKYLCFSDITKCVKATGELRKRENVTIQILSDVSSIFKENEITFWLDFGTLLGAVRHKGIIPWDFDCDVSFLQKNNEKVKRLLQDYCKKNDLDFSDNLGGLTIRTKNNENCIDFYRTQEFKSSLPKKELSQIFINERTKVQNKLREKIQITSDEIEAPFNIISSLEKRNINQKQKVEYIALAPSAKLSDRRLGFMKIDDLFPLVEMEFEGLMMPCPRNSKNWLDNLYVNIDQFPHLAFEAEAYFDLPYHSLVLPKGVRDKFSSDHVE